ncbi:hypothetical protein B0H17DRAFT_1130194 [Mycena rosella]|uniref:Uncharacterized protein n=1 Tax=Mycena rosella TaxID=1033263 RepID=A0AAD7GMI4_MYCRO|nr:hypothetical protein B0H17DRAFT_1130194 [Mycena rosella]
MTTKGFQVNRAQDTSVDSPHSHFAVRRGAPADIRSIETHIATSFDHESRPELAQVPLSQRLRFSGVNNPSFSGVVVNAEPISCHGTTPHYTYCRAQLNGAAIPSNQGKGT